MRPSKKKRTRRTWRETALREIQKLQASQLVENCLIPRSTFCSLVKELAMELKADAARFSERAMQAIQEASKAHTVSLFQGMVRLTYLYCTSYCVFVS